MIATDTVGEAALLSAWQDRTVQLFGTWDSATIVIEGSNDPRVISDPGNAVWETLRDPGGTALSFTADGLKAILELPAYIRPAKSGGAGSDVVTVIINARGDTL
jgi:hypothetical protein